MLSIKEVLIAIFAIGAIIFLERAFSFILFSKRKPPKFLRFIEQYIPPLIMTILVIYCLRGIDFSNPLSASPSFIALAITILVHLYKNNAMLSISLGTIIYMICQ